MKSLDKLIPYLYKTWISGWFSKKRAVKDIIASSNVTDGFFVCPDSKTNHELSHEMPSIILPLHFFDVIETWNRPLSNAIRYFARYNGLHLDESDDRRVRECLSIMTYMMVFYMRNFEGVNIHFKKNIPFLDVLPYLNEMRMRKMYDHLEHHLEKKGMTNHTARQVLRGASPLDHKAVENILYIFNTLEMQYYSGAKKDAVRRQLMYSYEELFEERLLNDEIGAVLERYVESYSHYISRYIRRHFHAKNCRIAPFDTDRRVKHKVSKKRVKVPDFIGIYAVDGTLAFMPLDTKLSTKDMDVRQVSAKTLQEGLRLAFP